MNELSAHPFMKDEHGERRQEQRSLFSGERGVLINGEDVLEQGASLSDTQHYFIAALNEIAGIEKVTREHSENRDIPQDSVHDFDEGVLLLDHEGHRRRSVSIIPHLITRPPERFHPLALHGTDHVSLRRGEMKVRIEVDEPIRSDGAEKLLTGRVREDFNLVSKLKETLLYIAKLSASGVGNKALGSQCENAEVDMQREVHRACNRWIDRLWTLLARDRCENL